MMENQEQEKEGQAETLICEKAKSFPITKLPTELQLQILGYVLVHDKPIVVSGFTSTYSFAAPPTPSFVVPNSPPLPSNLSTSSKKPWNHLPLSILFTSKHMYNLSYPLLFAHQTNTFVFTTPPSRQWSYARDWYWTFSFMLDHSKGTLTAMKRMSRVLFKCDGSMDNSLVGTALEYLPNMMVLTVDFKDFWGSPTATLEEEGRRDFGLGGFGGHVVLPNNESCDANATSSSTMTFSKTSNPLVGNWGSRGGRAGGYEMHEWRGEETFVSVVWRDVAVSCGKGKKVLRELRFSGLKMGKGNWDEVMGYGERVAGRKGDIEIDMEDGNI